VISPESTHWIKSILEAYKCVEGGITAR
jgi:hypothetical protein